MTDRPGSGGIAPVRPRWRRWALIAGVVVAVALAIRFYPTARSAATVPTRNVSAGQSFQHPLNGKPAPDFALRGIDGKPHRLSDYRGKPAVIVFWTTW